ncbi:MAG: Mur ligase family protein [Chloroflexi bacterium]|nr:Mur ligase family protein [Chloroflexota bacterium]
MNEIELEHLRIHIMGVGGAGMSAIARLLHARGVRVSGDDHADSPMLQSLRAAGIPAFVGHDPKHLDGEMLGGPVDVLAPSSAVPANSNELLEARRRGLRVWHRGDLLAVLLAGRVGIGVAGTHGKTTTSAMCATVLLDAGLDPSFIIGGNVPALGANARHGLGDPFVLEADEYDRTFLRYAPRVAVVTNVEFDHPDTYADEDAVFDAFAAYIASVPSDGFVVTCADDEGTVEAIRRSRRVHAAAATFVDYGLHRGAWRATNVRANTLGGMDFAFHGTSAGGGEVGGTCSLRVSGEHNVRNALAALIVADACGVPVAQAAAALSSYRGAERRFELKGEARGVRIIDDYAHHPTESRTAALLNEFAAAFRDADAVLVLPIYAARERAEDFGFAANALNPIEIARRIDGTKTRSAAGIGDAAGMLLSQVRGGDVVITLSAGDGNGVGARLLEMLRAG